MQGVLVRIGVDQAYGGWNAPVEPETGRFIYVPIPEKAGTRFHPNCRRGYDEVAPALEAFSDEIAHPKGRLPASLRRRAMHLDPDFERLTYGDKGKVRGKVIKTMTRGDIIVFYAGMRPPVMRPGGMVYAVTGLFVVDEIVEAADVPKPRWHENAHTRKVKRGDTDFVVRARPGVSGRCSRAIPIGEFRDGAYRVRRDVLDAWGGLAVNDGYIQRSARPPLLQDPRRFLRWFERQGVELVADNFGEPEPPRVILVHLRRPRRAAGESRDDPFWEFGSFGCTGCHRSNLMHPARIHELAGARLGFVQGGAEGARLVHLTPPVRIEEHRNRCEVRWSPVRMPFRYEHAPLLIRNDGATDFPVIRRLLRGSARSTLEAALTSAWRSRRRPLPQAAASELITTFDQRHLTADNGSLATEYWHAMPHAPPKIDQQRRCTYERLRRSAGAAASRRDCKPSGAKRPRRC